MTPQEADKIAEILATADNGCSDCVHALAKQMRAAFPQFAWVRMTDEALDRYHSPPAAKSPEKS